MTPKKKTKVPSDAAWGAPQKGPLISPLIHAEPQYPEVIHVYATAAQVVAFRQAAKARGWSVSAFLRHSAVQATAVEVAP